MNEQPWMENDALMDLLAKRATEGLEANEARELDRLLAEQGGDAEAGPSVGSPVGFEGVVAEMDVAFAEAEMSRGDAVPESVKAGLRGLGERFRAGAFDDVSDDDLSASLGGFSAPEAPVRELKLSGTKAEPSVLGARAAGSGAGVAVWGGWLAAAACLMVAAVAWWPSGISSEVPGTPASLTLTEQVDAFRAEPGVITLNWLGLDDAGLAEAPNSNDQDLRGEVIWNDETNEGFMVFEGLASNDPTAMQYQLWIFDSERRLGDLPQYEPIGIPILTQRPVDGGVFDSVPVGEGGKVIVPIRATLPVGQAAVFAITAEPPGGVVVSDRDIVTLALVPQG